MSKHRLPYGGPAPRRVLPPGAAFMRGMSRRTHLYSTGATRRSLPGYCPCEGSKIGIKKPEKLVPSLGAPCSAFLRVSHPLSLRILVGLPWSRPSPSICGHSPSERFPALRATPTPPWHCALPWCSWFTWSLRLWLPHLRRYALWLPSAHYSHHRPDPVQPPGWEVPCGYPHSTRLSVTVMFHW